MMLFVVLLAIIFILYLVKWRSSSTSPHQKVPSGPFPLPIVGNLLSLGDLPHIPVSSYMYKHKYKIMSMRFGSLPVVLINDPALMHEALVTKWKNFSSRPVLNSTRAYQNADEGGSNLVFANGETWKRYRRVVGAAFTRTKVRIQQRHLEAEIIQLNNQITRIAKQKTPVDFTFFTKRYALNIIQRLLLGTTLSYGSDELSSKLVHQVEGIMSRFGPKEYISDYVPMLSRLDKAKLTAFTDEVNAMRSIVYPHIQERQSNLDPDNPKDLLDAILIEAKQHAQDGLFSDMDIMLLCLDLYIAGTDTSSTSLDWFLYLLAKHPEYQEKIYSEISRNISDSEHYLKFAEVDKVPLMTATLRESNRLRPVAPLSVPRKNDEDDTIGGYFIPKDTTIFWNVYGYNHDPEVWANPEKFYPERFLDTKNELHNFGGGPRICVAKNLGEEEVYQACAMLCQRFTWQLDSPQTNRLDDGVASIVLHPNKHKLIFSAR